MPELVITAAGVAAIVNPTGNQITTVTARGVAGSTIGLGQVLYADPSVNNQLKPAQGTAQLQAANIVGIALGSAAVNQPIIYAIAGDVQLPSTPGVGGGTLTSGSVYVLAAGTPGNIVGIADANTPTTGNYISVVGIGNGGAAGTTNVLRLALIPSAVRL